MEDTMDAHGQPATTGPTTSHQATAVRQRKGVSPWAVLAIILTAVFMQLLDTTITMVGVPSIQASLHSSFGEIQLVVAGSPRHRRRDGRRRLSATHPSETPPSETPNGIPP